MLMDYMKEIKEISAEQAIILWQASRLSLSKIYEKAPEILKVQGSVIGTLGNFSASIGKAKSKKTFNVSAIVAAALKNGTVLRKYPLIPTLWMIFEDSTFAFRSGDKHRSRRIYGK